MGSTSGQTLSDGGILVADSTGPAPDFSDLMQMTDNNFEHDGQYNYMMMEDSQPPLHFDPSNFPNLFASVEPLHDLNSSSDTVTSIWGDNSPSNTPFTPQRMSSLRRSGTLSEHEAMSAALEAWPCFRCNPPIQSGTCPQTARYHLTGLEQLLNDQDAWISPIVFSDNLHPKTTSRLLTRPFVGGTRDKLIAVTQGLLHRALKTHSSGSITPNEGQSMSDLKSTGFIIVPPSKVLEHFLRACVCRFELHYPLIPANTLDPNELMSINNGKASSLLLLLMVAQGAMATPTNEAHRLASGLTEACRISLLDMIEKDYILSTDPIMLRCALLLTILEVWSGDKWHMDVAMSQRGMYTTMLGHADMFKYQEAKIPSLHGQLQPEAAWKAWKDCEGQNRLIYSWVMIDQELSLFHDTAPILSVTELNAAIPTSESLWQASSAKEWSSLLQKFHDASRRPWLSLSDLFQRFIEGELVDQDVELSPIRLRLLLHPLQALVSHLLQFLNCFSQGASHRKTSRAVTKSAWRSRLEEAHFLLQQWYALTRHADISGSQIDWVTCTNLIIYHLISLNTITSFPEIEQLARQEDVRGPFQQTFWLKIRSIEDAEEIFVHCGQVLRLIRLMPEEVRPPWWAAAVYRVALTSWANSMASFGLRLANDRSLSKESGRPFAVDALTPEHPPMVRYLKFREGIPMYTKRDGSMVSLERPETILRHCIDVLDEASTMRFTEGLTHKLKRCADRWTTSTEQFADQGQR
ncbi:MAG: hypothetical protein M1833_006185 [Piccolia ochrophora]|nr:MAG: hypothetical protein M1833_006185 [Piccolia ochrophora]